MIEQATIEHLKSILDDADLVLIDVREGVEYQNGFIQKALNVPLSTFNPMAFPEFPGKKVIIHCQKGGRSAQAIQNLLDIGYETPLYNLSGGYEAWAAAHYPTEEF